LGSKVWGKISGAQAKPKAKPPNPDSDSEDSEPDEGEAPEQTVANKAAKAIIARDKLIVQAKNIITARDAAITGLNALAAEDKNLNQVVALSKAAVPLAKAALDASKAIMNEVSSEAVKVDNAAQLRLAEEASARQKALKAGKPAIKPDLVAMEAEKTARTIQTTAVKKATETYNEAKSMYLSSQLYLKYAKQCDFKSQQFLVTSEAAGVEFEASKTEAEPEGNPDLLAAWQQAYAAFDNDFKAIQGKLTAIKDMDIQAIQDALTAEEKPKNPKVTAKK